VTEPWYPQLQALRALAVSGPVVMHLWPTDASSPLEARIVGIGYLGVDLFFVISGFLITGILLRARSAIGSTTTAVTVIGRFYGRRALRIFPVYWLLLLVLAIAGVPPVREEFWWMFLYAWNLRLADIASWPGHVSHFWSLAVEEQFYLAWPLLVLLLPLRQVPVAIAATCVLGPLYRLFAPSPWHATVLLPACVDVLGIGALLAWLHHTTPADSAARRRFTAVALALGLAGTAVHLALYLRDAAAWFTAWPLARTSCALLFAGLVDRAATGFKGTAGRVAEWQPLVFIGMISYGIYLLHPLTATLLRLHRFTGSMPTDAPVMFFLLQVSLTIGLAAASWYLLEKPVNSLRRHLPYPRP